MMEQWTQWIQGNPQVTPEQEQPGICHITEQQWGEIQRERATSNMSPKRPQCREKTHTARKRQLQVII